METTMSETEINRYIATEIMGLCWHEITTSVEKYGGMRTYRVTCPKCKAPWIPEHEFYNVEPSSKDFIPDYCSDSSPRSLLDEPRGVVIAKVGRVTYENQLAIVTDADIWHVGDDQRLDARQDGLKMLNATALQISTAIMNAHKASKGGSDGK